MSRRKKKAKPDNRCCENCVNCLPVGDGDHICNMDPSKAVLEEYSFSADYFWCGGSLWAEEQRMYYNECPLCGANLDPGEPCDCQEEKKSKKKLQLKNQSEHRNRALQLCAEAGYQI